jgi:hypothetical protein
MTAAIFLERDGVITNPLPDPLPRWQIQFYRFWRLFGDPKAMNDYREWSAFWRAARELGEMVMARIQWFAARKKERIGQHRSSAKPDITIGWDRMSRRHQIRAAVLSLAPENVFLGDCWAPLSLLDDLGYQAFFVVDDRPLAEERSLNFGQETLIDYQWYATLWCRMLGYTVGQPGHSWLVHQGSIIDVLKEIADQHGIDLSCSLFVTARPRLFFAVRQIGLNLLDYRPDQTRSHPLAVAIERILAPDWPSGDPSPEKGPHDAKNNLTGLADRPAWR